MPTLTPFDGDFAPDKRSEYERFMNAIADNRMRWLKEIEEDEELAVCVLDYMVRIQFNFPIKHTDKETGETFDEDMGFENYVAPLPPGWSLEQANELFGEEGLTVYFHIAQPLDEVEVPDEFYKNIDNCGWNPVENYCFRDRCEECPYYPLNFRDDYLTANPDLKSEE